MGREDDIEFIKWSKQVKIRDGFCCTICGERGGYLESHHLNSWDTFIEERYDESNGTSLCLHHHRSFHEAFGYGNNTKDQFKQYLIIIKKFEQIIKLRMILNEQLRQSISKEKQSEVGVQEG